MKTLLTLAALMVISGLIIVGMLIVIAPKNDLVCKFMNGQPEYRPDQRAILGTCRIPWVDKIFKPVEAICCRL